MRAWLRRRTRVAAARRQWPERGGWAACGSGAIQLYSTTASYKGILARRASGAGPGRVGGASLPQSCAASVDTLQRGMLFPRASTRRASSPAMSVWGGRERPAVSDAAAAISRPRGQVKSSSPGCTCAGQIKALELAQAGKALRALGCDACPREIQRLQILARDNELQWRRGQADRVSGRPRRRSPCPPCRAYRYCVVRHCIAAGQVEGVQMRQVHNVWWWRW